MQSQTTQRTLVVANQTASTPLLLQEVERRARERPTTFALLIPNVQTRSRADWTMERALSLLERAARGPVQGIVGGADPFESVKQALAEVSYDDVLISTLPKRVSAWLRTDLPRKVQRLGVPVTVISQEEEGSDVLKTMRTRAMGGGAGGLGGG
jgi:hypothetical protein